MADEKTDACCPEPSKTPMRGFKVEAVATVDSRGQMVLPKEIRDRAGIEPGDKLAVTLMEADGKVCCITLIKIEELSGMIRDMLGPVFKDIV
jgi:AbrB family looped-hinge helix DNA binding protein